MTFGRKWLLYHIGYLSLLRPSSAFFGLLREFHESTRHHLDECHVDHIQRAHRLAQGSIAAQAASNWRSSKDSKHHGKQ